MKRAVFVVLCCLTFAVQAADAPPPKASFGKVSSGSAKGFFRWTDKDGVVHYGDHLPPEQSQVGGTKYGAAGLGKQTIEGAKTPEQLEAEKRLKQLRVEQERLVNEQKDRDQALLRSFRSDEEVRLALKGNLSTLDTQLKVIQVNLQRQQEKLAPLQQNVANLQKEGKPVSKGLTDNLDAVQRQVASYQDQIAKTEKEKQALTEHAEQDVARLNALKAQQNGSNRTPSETAQGQAMDLLLGAVSCRGKEICDKGWDAARSYLQKRLPVPLSIDTERILRTAEPSGDSEFAMLVTHISGQNGDDTFFLDIRCLRSVSGQALCTSDKAQEVRREFRKVVSDAMGLPAQ